MERCPRFLSTDIGRSQMLWSDYEYFTQHGFIFADGLDTSSIPQENWLAAYNYFAAKTEIDFLNQKTGPYRLATDQGLMDKLREVLPLVDHLQWPIYRDQDGNEIHAYEPCVAISETQQRCHGVWTSFGNEEHAQHPRLLQELQKVRLWQAHFSSGSFNNPCIQ